MAYDLEKIWGCSTRTPGNLWMTAMLMIPSFLDNQCIWPARECIHILKKNLMKIFITSFEFGYKLIYIEIYVWLLEQKHVQRVPVLMGFTEDDGLLFSTRYRLRVSLQSMDRFEIFREMLYLATLTKCCLKKPWTNLNRFFLVKIF